MLRRFLLTAAVVTAFAGMASAQAPIKVGAFLAVTGPASFVGDPEAKTLRLLADELNAKGGVLGRRIEVVIHDSTGDAKAAEVFARHLIEDDKVDVIVGGSTTGETMAAVPLAEGAGIPFISLAGASVVVEPVKKWVFKTPHSDHMAVEKSYADMRKRGLSKVAIVGGTGGFDQSCRAEAKKLAGKYGIQVVAEEIYGPQDTDVTPQIAKIKATSGVEAVFGCGFGAINATTAKTHRQLGLTQPLYFTHAAASQGFIDGAGGGAEGVRLPAAALVVAEQLPDSDPQKAPGVAYSKSYGAKYGEAVTIFGGHAHDGLMLAVEAIRRAGSTDKAKVRDEIEKIRNHVGVDGIYNMTAADHMGLDLASFKMLVIRNGRFVLAE